MGPFQFISDYIEKARSYIYGIYMFWLSVFAAPILFTAIFVDQEILFRKTHLLKNEYIRSEFFSFETLGDWIYIISLVVCPLVMTWLVIWILPKKLVRSAYQEELENQYEREFMKLDKEDELTNRRSKVVQEQEQVVAKEEQVSQKQEQIVSREVNKWERDYEVFRQDPTYSDFTQIITSVYEFGGRISRAGYGNTPDFRISPAILARADSFGLVNIKNKDHMIELTDKGKYFVSKFPMRGGA